VRGSFAYSFLLGVLAAVNPCGFVLLPAWLIAYMGGESRRADPLPRRLGRALGVGARVSAGFLAVFLAVGLVSRLATQWLERQARWAALAIGLALVVGGLRMLGGWRPRLVLPDVGGERRGPVLFGVAYAVASIGCTIGFLTTAVLGTVATEGFASGVASLALYGAGMSLVVVALTVSLALATDVLVRGLRRVSRVLDPIAGVAVTLTGVYLTWYWWSAISGRGSGGAVRRVESLQTRLVGWIQSQGSWRIGLVAGAVVLVAAVAAATQGAMRSRRQVPGAGA
jgi:cytochrome c biogenesis protein CcdA